jgi:NAD(P)-dependent dehydrogenase (short-subunit alcohol dehydrogenase family)
MHVFVISGTSRGIGIGYIQELAKDGANVVFALTRNPQTSTALQSAAASGPATVHLVECDTSDADSISRLPTTIKDLLPQGIGIDVLINNAALLKDSQLKSTDLTYESMSQHMAANVLGPARMLAALLPLLAEGAVVANITSGLGSNAKLFDGRIRAHNIPYSLSKAALNMLTVHQSKELEGRVVAIAVDPGHVKTEMGGIGATMEVEDSVRSILQTISRVRPEDSGKFLLYNGTSLPW